MSAVKEFVFLYPFYFILSFFMSFFLFPFFTFFFFFKLKEELENSEKQLSAKQEDLKAKEKTHRAYKLELSLSLFPLSILVLYLGFD